MLIRHALANGRSHLSSTSPTPDLDARLLLQHVLQVGHPYLVAHADEEITAVALSQYHACLQRAAQKEPIPYIIGHAPFYGLEFRVSPAVLIPRPETEQLVEMAIHWARLRGGLRIADVGTGSGCIPLTLARHLPQTPIQASDISVEALIIARRNAEALAPGRVAFYLGHLLGPLTPPFDLITANLPYVTDGEWTMLDDGVKLHEPALALRGGPDGLNLIRQLLAQAADVLSPGGLMILEIGWQQGPPARALAQSCFPTAVVAIQPDFAGHDRFVIIQTASD
jgi:release factor glutamine methyltransferase